MRKLLFVAAVLGLAACAEIDTDALGQGDSAQPSAETLTVGRTVVVETEDGSTFEVAIIHDGSLTTIEEADILDSITVVGIRPVDEAGITPVGASAGYVPPVDPRLVPDEGRPVNIYVTGVDADTVLGDYRWDWLDDIDAEDIEAWIEDICPPWH